MPKLRRPILSDERIRDRQEMLAALDRGEIDLGTAIRRMRRDWTGLSQGRLGKIVGVSANTLSAIERDPECATVKTLNRILRKFGMRLTMTSISATPHGRFTDRSSPSDP